MSTLALALALLTNAENPYLAEAKALANGLEFERCLERLKQAQTQWHSTPDELGEVEVWSGLCHFNLGHRRQAVEHFRTALRIDEGTDLPPYSSPKAVESLCRSSSPCVNRPSRCPTSTCQPTRRLGST